MNSALSQRDKLNQALPPLSSVEKAPSPGTDPFRVLQINLLTPLNSHHDKPKTGLRALEMTKVPTHGTVTGSGTSTWLKLGPSASSRTYMAKILPKLYLAAAAATWLIEQVWG